MAETFQQAQFADFAPQSATHFAHHDPSQWLPPGAADKFQRLQQDVEDARALLPDFETRREASNERLAAAQRLKRLQDPAQQGGFNLPDENLSVSVARRELAKADAALTRIDDLHKQRSSALQAANAVLSNIMGWIRAGRPGSTVLEEVEIEPPKLNRGEAVRDAIERLRRRGRELKADAHRIRSAPYPSRFCKERAKAQVEALAERGTPDVAMLIEHGADIAWPTQNMTAMVHSKEIPALAFAQVIDVPALFAWTFRETLIAKLDAEIDAAADDANALSPEARAEAEAEVLADLLAVERDECALVWRSEGQVEHRADADPRALLGLALVTLARPTAPTSAAMAVDFMGPI
jgi:hypothetical protein